MFVLNGLLKAESQEKILIYLLVRKSGYAKAIADFFDVGVTPIQKQVLKLEEQGILVGSNIGRSRVFQLNPQYRLLPELKALIEGAFKAYPTEVKERLLMERSKPRRTGKPSTKVYR